MKTGDVVRIINPNQVYSTYTKMADLMGLPHWVPGTQADKLSVDSTFLVWDIREHTDANSCMVCGIDNGTISMLIDVSGLELIKKLPLTSRREKSKKYWQERAKRGN